jgi:hypothetical protein
MGTISRRRGKSLWLWTGGGLVGGFLGSAGWDDDERCSYNHTERQHRHDENAQHQYGNLTFC